MPQPVPPPSTSDQQRQTETLVIKKRPEKGEGKEKQITEAMRRGDDIETKKKITGGRNIMSGGPLPNAAQLDQDTGDYHVEKVTLSFGKALQQARQAKGMTQTQLAQAINEKHSVVNDYEAGRAIPSGQIIQKLNKTLGVKLPPARGPKSQESSLL